MSQLWDLCLRRGCDEKSLALYEVTFWRPCHQFMDCSFPNNVILASLGIGLDRLSPTESYVLDSKRSLPMTSTYPFKLLFRADIYTHRRRPVGTVDKVQSFLWKWKGKNTNIRLFSWIIFVTFLFVQAMTKADRLLVARFWQMPANKIFGRRPCFSASCSRSLTYAFVWFGG